MKSLILVCLLVSCSSLSAGRTPLDTVDHVDLHRYLGKWYEIARFDQRFQRNCTATTAEYRLRRDGDIDVINSCRLYSPKGKLKKAKGRAWVVDRSSNAKLKVQFFLRGLRIPLFAGNYWIIALDEEEYQYAMIGDPSRKYLWILGRKEQLDKVVLQELVEKAKDLHFDTSKLLYTNH